MNHLAALIYLAALSGILAAGIKSPRLGWPSALVAIFVLVWAALILTAHALSLFSAINVTSAYIALSVFIAVAASLGLRRITLQDDVSFPPFSSRSGPGGAPPTAW